MVGCLCWLLPGVEANSLVLFRFLIQLKSELIFGSIPTYGQRKHPAFPLKLMLFGNASFLCRSAERRDGSTGIIARFEVQGYRASPPSPACCTCRVASCLSLTQSPGWCAWVMSGVTLSCLPLSTACESRVYGSVAHGNGLAEQHQLVQWLPGEMSTFISLSTTSLLTFGWHGILESCVWVMPVLLLTCFFSYLCILSWGWGWDGPATRGTSCQALLAMWQAVPCIRFPVGRVFHWWADLSRA